MGNNCSCQGCENKDLITDDDVLGDVKNKSPEILTKKQSSIEPLKQRSSDIKQQNEAKVYKITGDQRYQKETLKSQKSLNEYKLEFNMISSQKRAKLPSVESRNDEQKLASNGNLQFSAQTALNYVGETLEDKRHGQGRQNWNDQSFYQGQWIYDAAEGKGKFQYSDGSVYIGQWKNNKAEGRGVFLENDGHQWVGKWEQDVLLGIGLEINSDYKYEGLFQQGYKEGEGKIEWKYGALFAGQWLDDKIEGYGMYRWNDGRTYEGEWKNNLQNGKGILIFPRGSTYEGEFYNDMKHGYGLLTKKNGVQIEGVWQMGKLQGLAIQTSPKDGKQLIQYECGQVVRKFERCHINTIFPEGWVPVKEQLKNQRLKVEKTIQDMQEELKELSELLQIELSGHQQIQ